MKTITIKRIYEKPEPNDGYRVLVDRLWPRGVKKETAALNEWNKTIPPSPELRKWFNHQPELFTEFKRRYKEELKTKEEDLNRLKTIAGKQNVTLLYSAKDPKINQAIVLLEVLTKMK
ncbi:MAG: DUF488 domain-containing protein [Bacteroidetes bacterium]|nr:DUF488 domain-containing protein [Bacteroidota bacterium]MBS1650291.1 DUF488 domain-containing protein [Bacteroidota bacterium]